MTFYRGTASSWPPGNPVAAGFLISRSPFARGGANDTLAIEDQHS
jgi:hypothetical protein